MTAAAPTAPRFEHRTDDGPVLGIGTGTPRLSWQVPSAGPGFAQDAYEVELVRGEAAPETVSVESGDQVLVGWPGRPLASRESVRVRVRVHGAGQWSPWSEPATVEAGLLRAEDWTAGFVSPVAGGGSADPAPLLRGTFQVPGRVVKARLYVSAHGVYVATLNGRRVGADVLAPGWTSYHHRLRYQTHDVTDLLTAGGNELRVLLGNGWYRGRLGWQGRQPYGDRLGLLAQLEVTTAEGAVHTFTSDESWTASESGVLADDLYDGQRTDLRRGSAGVGSGAVEPIPADLSRLVAPDGPPVRITQVVPAARVWASPSGRTLVDFGQNLVGWVRLHASGDAGDEVIVRHAEVLEDGELGVRPLRTAKATDSYLLAGSGAELLEPELTFHGFRYAEVSGVADLAVGDIAAVVVGSDLRRTGWFESSHQLLNRFHENVVWGMRGNTLDVPTDCPQRDERLGWTGDIQVFSPTASFLFDVGGFLTSWLADLAVEQHKDGSVPFVVPDVLGGAGPAAAAWGDAATVVPWVLYQRTGDAGQLARQLPSMRAWVDRIAGLAGRDLLWSGGFQFGDWLDPAAPPDNPFQADTDPDVVATAHLVRSADLVARAAGVLGRSEIADRYGELAAAARAAFAREYVTAGGRVLSDASTAYGMALEWDLLPSAQQRERAGARLADLVRGAGFRISTGFVGTPLLTDALTGTGHVEIAYRLMLATGCPSWLYPVTMGATTVWERWDSMLPDGSINPGDMTSFNHYALGAVADWLHRTVAGLAPGAPGYRELVVRPIPGGGLTWARARHDTPYGEAAVAWERGEGRLRLRVTVPVGVHATVHVPGAGDPVRVGHGTHEWEVDDPVAEDPGLSEDPVIRDLIDDPSTWELIVSAATGSGVAADDVAVARRLRPHLDAPAAAVADALTGRGFVPGAAQLRDALRPLQQRLGG